MDISKLSNANLAYLNNKPQKTGETSKTVTEPKKYGNKKLKLAFMGLAAIGAAGAIGFAIYKGKGKSIKLSDIKFDKGKALNETGEAFSGKIKDKLQNGDTVEMVYENGILKQSARKGTKNFTKVFEENNGEKIVKTIIGDSETSTNITKIAKEGKELDEKIKLLVELSSKYREYDAEIGHYFGGETSLTNLEGSFRTCVDYNEKGDAWRAESYAQSFYLKQRHLKHAYEEITKIANKAREINKSVPSGRPEKELVEWLARPLKYVEICEHILSYDFSFLEDEKYSTEEIFQKICAECKRVPDRRVPG